jgi:NTE family protein
MNQQERQVPTVQRALILSGGGARGAYQVGVWKRLQELGWQPDLVCGTSIGSINGCLIGMGWGADRIESFWRSLDREKIFRFSLWRRFKYWVQKLFGKQRDWPALLDNRPLRQMLEEVIEVERLRDASPEVVVTATNVRRAQLHYFAGPELTVDHVLASCSIPVVFPWQELDGELYWDGGIMANTPILPAVQRGAREIIVVLLAPLTGEPVPPPRDTRGAIAWTMDLVTIASVNSLMAYLSQHLGVGVENAARAITSDHFLEMGGVRIGVVAPLSSSGLETILDLDLREIQERIEAGYRDAGEQLSGFIRTDDLQRATVGADVTPPGNTVLPTEHPDYPSSGG